ncbi:hypothetical protein HL658_25205 [Azospirillum sp. RWY-5-1]|uniref:VOC domain-containing protein n=1 Tax=Azospirillum oleiclasticum TaxID=2735135 RepID=A0ABX2TDI6_9PROT|nr:VOC family protein [Azospirillum oleiclasticum]NYZ15852.1 hypothetical protein [Azospirillum oleiclasticum]NYZ22122.1 hypothetical protein [Azospirillum oleiclasticum]
MITKIYGVNVAVADLEAATRKYEAFFNVKARPIGEKFFAVPGLDGNEIKVGDFCINLIASKEEGTSIAKFVEKKGEGLFLLSVEVDNYGEDAAEMKGKGVKFLMEEPIDAAMGLVNFVHPKSMAGVQIEVFQPSREMLER